MGIFPSRKMPLQQLEPLFIKMLLTRDGLGTRVGLCLSFPYCYNPSRVPSRPEEPSVSHFPTPCDTIGVSFFYCFLFLRQGAVYLFNEIKQPKSPSLKLPPLKSPDLDLLCGR